MCWIVATRTCQMVGYLTLKKKVVTDSSGEIQFCCKGWLRGVDLNHRPLGYEPNELPDCSTPRTDNNNPPICRQTCAWSGLMSRRLFKKTEGVGFPFQIEIFAFTKHTMGRVRRRTSTKQRGSADRIIYSIFPPPACAGKDPGGKPSQ